jgi:uncharacterized protein YqcC (DUF446 family)
MSERVRTLLTELETELKQQGLWAETAPDSKALQSTLPFCYDTLPLEHWLQFIFLSRMQALLDAKQTLPATIAILPIAELAFAGTLSKPDSLLDVIRRIDNALSGKL